MALSGPIDPYLGIPGVIEAGALAELVLVDGNPLEEIKLLEDPGWNFIVIMKDGKIHMNILPNPRPNFQTSSGAVRAK